MRVAVLGGNGQLGSDLVAHLLASGDAAVSLTHEELEVADRDSLRRALSALAPEVVINCAAFHHPLRCEEDPARAFAVNAVGARNVALAAAELGAAVLYFSTDYVFDGSATEPYDETDAPHPLSVYGASKLAGEHLTLAGPGRGWVVRVSAIYGRVPSRAKGDNFLTMILRRARQQSEVRVVEDEITVPTPTAEIARATREILLGGEPGLYHLACAGSCSWYEFARALFEIGGIETPLWPARAVDFPGPVRRPAYSVLATRRFDALRRGPMPHWRVALETFLAGPGAPLLCSGPAAE